MKLQQTDQPKGPTVFYDGNCPLCSREIGFYRRRKSLATFQWTDVSSCTDAELPVGITREQALARFHVLLRDGTFVSGPKAFGELWTHIKGFAWFGRLLQLQSLQPTLEFLYRQFLKVRFAILSRFNSPTKSNCSRC